jgi:serine/threonine protein kinase
VAKPQITQKVRINIKFLTIFSV